MVVVVVGDPAELRVDEVVEGGGLVAREGVPGVVAGQRLLVEDGLVAAEKGVLVGTHDLSKIVLDGQTHVEHLTIIINVRIVAILATLAGKGLCRLANDVFVS